MKKAPKKLRAFIISSESKPTRKLDQFNKRGLNAWQGLRTLQLSASMTVNHGFFMPFSQFFTGRGGVGAIQHPLWERLMRRLLLAVLNTPIALRCNHLRKTKGGFHA